MFANVNFIAMGLAIVASMVIGAIWYSVLAKPWMAAAGFNDEQIQKVNEGGNPSTYLFAVLSHIIMAYVLSGIIYHAGGFSLYGGVISALFCWVGFVVTTMTVTHRFQMRPWSLTAIDAGHFLFVMVAQGAILGWFGV